MVGKSSIEWTEQTYNPIVGCSIVSPGCTNCYAMKMAARIEAMGTQPRYAGTTRKVNGKAIWTGKIAQAPEATLLAPLRRKIPTTYFVNSMSDLFHEDIPDEWIDQIFAVMACAGNHTFQVLTKRAQRMRNYVSNLTRERIRRAAYAPIHRCVQYEGRWLFDLPLPNVWLGVSTERQQEADERIPLLLQTPAAIRFISAEPLLGPLDLTSLVYCEAGGGDPDYIVDATSGQTGWRDGDGWEPSGLTRKLDWVIVGGESGRGARPVHPDWVRSLRDQCGSAGVPLFFKQWGQWLPGEVYAEGNSGGFARHQDGTDGDHRGKPDHWWSGSAFGGVISTSVGKKAAGRLLDGVEHNGMPRIAA